MRCSRRNVLRTVLGGVAFSQMSALQGWSAQSVRACEQNLRTIFDAVKHYQQLRGQLPTSLSALVPAGLIDRRLLVCPSLVGSGLNSPSNRWQVDNLGPDPLTRYQWEFSNEQAARHEKQRKIGAGDWVAMVRCSEHSGPEGASHLNLALNGAIYWSGLEWEHALREIIPYPYLTSKKALNEEPLIPLAERIPLRAPQSTAAQLDLGGAFNSALTDAWPEGWDGEQAPDLLALGGNNRLWSHEGITFELRGVIQLEGAAAAAVHPEVKEARFPHASRSIECTVETDCLHLLAGVIKACDATTVAGKVTLEDVHGDKFELLLQHGAHVAHGAVLSSPKSSQIAWSRPRPQLNFGKSDPDTAALSVSHVVWPLGRKVMVRRLMFRADQSACYPFLLAVTAG
jgi:hypothetical protein